MNRPTPRSTRPATLFPYPTPFRSDDGDAEAVARPGQFLRTRIDAAARLGHAGNMLDRRLPFEIFQLDAQALILAERFFRITADIALADRKSTRLKSSH